MRLFHAVFSRTFWIGKTAEQGTQSQVSHGVFLSRKQFARMRRTALRLALGRCGGHTGSRALRGEQLNNVENTSTIIHLEMSMKCHRGLVEVLAAFMVAFLGDSRRRSGKATTATGPTNTVETQTISEQFNESTDSQFAKTASSATVLPTANTSHLVAALDFPSGLTTPRPAMGRYRHGLVSL